MKKKRTTPYRFRLGAQSAKFQRAYHDELGRLRLAQRIAELRERCGLTQAQLADKVVQHKLEFLAWKTLTIDTTR